MHQNTDVSYFDSKLFNLLATVEATSATSATYSSTTNYAKAVASHTYPQYASTHTHPYLSTSGGTVNGNIKSNNVITGTVYVCGTNGNAYIKAKDVSANNETLQLLAGGYLNLQASSVQCRNFADNAWIGIACTGVEPQQNSSRKLKDNILDMTVDRARKILDLNIVTFDYKEGVMDEEHRYNRTGVITEDTLSICPEVVNFDKGEPSGVNYEKFVPYLIKMIQLQQKEIQDLKSKIL